MYSNYTYKVTAIRTKGLSATCITGEIRNDKDLQVRVMNGKLHIVLELLFTNTLWRQMVRLSVHVVHLVALVVNEAHCVTKW